MRQILDLERLGEAPEGGVGDSQSLYFTPAGTPLREALFRNGSDMVVLLDFSLNFIYIFWRARMCWPLLCVPMSPIYDF